MAIRSLLGAMLLAGLCACGKPRPSDAAASDATVRRGEMSPPESLTDASHPAAEPQGPLSRIAQAVTPELKAALAKSLVATMSPDELRALIHSLADLPVGADRDLLAEAALVKFVATSPREALDLAARIDPDAPRSGITSAVAEAWAAVDYGAVLAYARSLQAGVFRQRVGAAAVSVWSGKDPEGCFRALTAMGFRDEGMHIGMAAGNLALIDRERALQLLDLVEDPLQWNRAAARVFSSAASQDLDWGVRFFSAQEDPEVISSLSYALGSVFAGKSVPDGIDTLNAITESGPSNLFLRGLITNGLSRDAQGLLGGVPAIVDPATRRTAARLVSSSLASQDPKSATEWAATLQEPSTRSQAFRGAASGFADHDPQAAQAWLKTLPPGQDRHDAIVGFADRLSTSDPQTAATWAQQISEPKVRARLIRDVLGRWQQQDARAASTWARATGNEASLAQ